MRQQGEKIQAEILSVLRHHPIPMSAYDIQDMLRSSHPKIAPPTVYRALSSLMGKGHVHRLESLNAFVACQCLGEKQGEKHSAILSVCGDCGVVEESISSDVLDQLSCVAGQSGFQASRHVIEVHGRCAACYEKEGGL
ncbi:transcriptional repressor [Aliiroseovarius crassostreae]|uniref:transcriptional repressor n=1 Tax=Aliiroseovarius crassostreae TaxID=154981 RepID=UPI003C7A6AFD